MWKEILFLLIGFAVLLGGADILIRGACSIARALGVSTLIVGLTVVAFGTSAPELFVSATAAYGGNADVAVGNIIGSNLFNILVIVGVSSLITPVCIASAFVRREMPIMLVCLGLFLIFSANLEISRLEGGFFFLGIIAYLVMNYFVSKREHKELKSKTEEFRLSRLKLFINLVFILLGFFGLVFGADLIIDNATVLAKHYGVSDLVIGITLVAIGTSLPELATTLVAAMKNEADLAIGNAVGSNIFNVCCVIGLTSLITPLSVNPQALRFDMIYMVIACLIAWFFMRRRHLGRIAGAIMLLGYFAYIYFVFVNELSNL